MRTKNTTPRSTIRQTLYPVIRVRRRRYLDNARPEARTEHAYPGQAKAEKVRAP